MTILTIRTDKPEAELSIRKDRQLLTEHSWQAHRQLAESIHNETLKLLQSHDLRLSGIEGIVAYKGPGSFTGLRIGLSVANALAYGLGIPIVGATGGDWSAKGARKLDLGDDEKHVVPEYGSPAHITTPKK